MSSESILDSRSRPSTSMVLRRKASSSIRDMKLWLIKTKTSRLDSCMLLVLSRACKEPSPPNPDAEHGADQGKGRESGPWKLVPLSVPVSVSVPQEQTCALGLATLSISCLPACCHSITSTLAAGWYGLSLTRKERKRRREQDPAEELRWECRVGWDEWSLPHGPGTFPADMGAVPRDLL